MTITGWRSIVTDKAGAVMGREERKQSLRKVTTENVCVRERERGGGVSEK